MLLSVRGGLGVGDTRVIVVINAGHGVVGWVVVVASLTQMVGSWVRSWLWLSCCRHKWWGCGGGGVMVVGIVSLTLVVGSWLWLWSWWWLWLWWVVNMGGKVVVGCVVVIAVASLMQVVGWWVVVVIVLMVVAGSSMLVVGRWLLRC